MKNLYICAKVCVPAFHLNIGRDGVGVFFLNVLTIKPSAENQIVDITLLKFINYCSDIWCKKKRKEKGKYVNICVWFVNFEQEILDKVVGILLPLNMPLKDFA